MKIKSPFSFLVVSAVGFATALGAVQTRAAEPVAAATPCMGVLDRFTAPDVPAMGPDETLTPPGRWPDAPAPAGLPGKGMAEHPMLYLGEGYDKMFVVKDGKVLWTYSTGTSNEYDDVWMLSNGNILFSRMEYVAEVTPEKKTVWRYDCGRGSGADHQEIHTCQPIGTDRVMFVVNGLPPRLMVVNVKTGATEVEHEIPWPQAQDPKGIHGQFRRARYTAQGTYLLPFLSLGVVVEYDKDFHEIWRYRCAKPWAALRLKNGNTLITDEADDLTREVNPRGETVWECRNGDLPEPYRLVSAPQSVTRLANGDTIFTSRGKNGQGPQLVEVTPEKRVVWVLQDWQTLGPATAVQILDDPGIPENPGESEH